MTNKFTLAGLYIGAGLMLCSLIFSIIITPITIQIADIPVEIISAVINLIGAVIVYYSFTEQRKANRIQIDALAEERERSNNLNKFNQIVNLIKDVEDLHANFTVTLFKKGIIEDHKGDVAFNLFIRKINMVNKEGNHSDFFLFLAEETIRYFSFLDIVSFTGKSIISFPFSTDHSREVLEIKFGNVVSKFEHILLMVYSSSLDNDDKRSRIVGLDSRSLKVYQLIQEIKQIRAHIVAKSI